MATKDVEKQKKEEPTISPDPKASETNGLKTVNIPVSASNALQGDAGIQVNVPEGATKEKVVQDPYNPQSIKLQNELDGDVEDNGRVSKAKYDQLLDAFNEVLTSHNLDEVHVNTYKAKAGIK